MISTRSIVSWPNQALWLQHEWEGELFVPSGAYRYGLML